MPYRQDGSGTGKWTGYNLWSCSGCGDYIDGDKDEWELGDKDKTDKLRHYIDSHFAICKPYRETQGLDRPNPVE